MNDQIVILRDGKLEEVTPEELVELLPLPDPIPEPDPEPIDEIPSIVSKSVTPSKSGAIIRVIASEPSEIDIRYGLGDSYEMGKVSEDEAKIEHRLEITDLQPDTEYHYQIRLEDVTDQVSVSEDFVFKTLEEISDPVPGDHAHYEREKVKSGVASYASYRVPAGEVWVEEQRVDGRSWDEVRNTDPGDADYPFYDASIDGLKIPVVVGEKSAQKQLRRRFPDQRINGSFWNQVEMMPSNAFIFEWDGGYKLYRWEDEEEGVGDKRILTTNCGAGNGADTALYHRDGEKVWQRNLQADGSIEFDRKREVRIRYDFEDDPTLNEQPGGETSVWYRGNLPSDTDDPERDKPGFYWSADVWHRITWHFDTKNGLLHCWAQKLSGSDTKVYKVLEFPIEHWKGNTRFGVTRCGFWGHSTSGVVGNGVTWWGYRNLIVSSKEIALQ